MCFYSWILNICYIINLSLIYDFFMEESVNLKYEEKFQKMCVLSF